MDSHSLQGCKCVKLISTMLVRVKIHLCQIYTSNKLSAQKCYKLIIYDTKKYM